jgi:hypothetical protein
MRLHPTIVRALSFVTLVAVAPRPAQACTRPLCLSPTFSFPAGAVLPANVPYLPFFSDLDPDKGGPVHPESWRLVRDDGTAVDIELKANRIVPRAPLEPGRGYKVLYPADCQAKPRIGEQAFQAGPAGPLDGNTPGDVGTVSVTTSIERYQVPGGPCDPTPRFIEQAAVARVHFTPSEAVRPWTPVARLGFEVDRFNTGAYAGSEGVLAGDPETVTTYVVDCSAPTTGMLGLGTHKVYLWFWVGDQRFPTPSTASFELSCAHSADAGTVPPVICDGGSHSTAKPDGGSPDLAKSDGGSPDTAKPDGGAGNPDGMAADADPTAQPPVSLPSTPAPTDHAADAGGCSLAPTGSTGAPAALFLILALTLVARRRRLAPRRR